MKDADATLKHLIMYILREIFSSIEEKIVAREMW